MTVKKILEWKTLAFLSDRKSGRLMGDPSVSASTSDVVHPHVLSYNKGSLCAKITRTRGVLLRCKFSLLAAERPILSCVKIRWVIEKGNLKTLWIKVYFFKSRWPFHLHLYRDHVTSPRQFSQFNNLPSSHVRNTNESPTGVRFGLAWKIKPE